MTLQDFLIKKSNEGGLFSLKEAVQHGISRQLVHYHTRTGSIVRVKRGMYRSAFYPRTAYEVMNDYIAHNWTKA